MGEAFAYPGAMEGSAKRAGATPSGDPVTRPRGAMRNILRNTGWLLGGKGLSAVLSLIYLAIVARSLGVAGFGKFTLVLGAAQAIELLASFQSWQIVVRYGIPHFTARRDGELNDLLRFCTLLDVVAALVSAATVSVVYIGMGRYFGWTDKLVGGAIAFGILFTISTHWTPIGILRMRDRFDIATFADAATPIVRCIGAVTMLAIKPGAIAFFGVWAVAEFLTAVAYWIAALRVQPIRWNLGQGPRLRAIKASNPGILRYALATNVNSSLDVGGKQVAVLIVGFLLSPAAVGGFRMAQQLAQGVAKFSQTLGRAIFPELMRSRADEDGERAFATLLRRTFRLTASGAAIVVTVVLLLGQPLIGLIGGKQFLGAYPLLQILGLAAAIDFAAVAFEPALVAMGRAGLALKLRLVSTSVLLGGIVVLIPLWETKGAALAVLAASLTSTALLWFALRPLVSASRGASKMLNDAAADRQRELL